MLAFTLKVPESMRKDRTYWDRPFRERAYYRVLYAISGFIITATFFDVVLHAPFWLQLVMGSAVALAALLFRIAYPNGFKGTEKWMYEAMLEAQETAESRGTPFEGANSEQIKAKLDSINEATAAEEASRDAVKPREKQGKTGKRRR